MKYVSMDVNNPNFSVIIPAGCNAKCQFCYWEADNGLKVSTFVKAIENLNRDLFKSITITGGEPTLSNDLDIYLSIAREYFDKVVLNTNGYKLENSHIDKCSYINISRHHYNDAINNLRFGTNTVPTKNKLADLCNCGKVTLNCYLPTGFSDFKFVYDYVLFAKELGAKVAFRKDHEDLTLLPVDDNSTLVDTHSCGVCIHNKHIINDVEVTFKYGLRETQSSTNRAYELILHSNGKVTTDWAGNNVIWEDTPNLVIKPTTYFTSVPSYKQAVGCGTRTGC